MSRFHDTQTGGASILTRVIPSRLGEVDGFCREAKEMLASHGLHALFFRLDLLAREFINNAILHGNGSDEGKKVTVTMKISRKWLSLVITDEGPGFRWRMMRRKEAEETDTNGRGLSIGSLYADRMVFSGSGNKVTLWLKR